MLITIKSAAKIQKNNENENKKKKKNYRLYLKVFNRSLGFAAFTARALLAFYQLDKRKRSY